MVPERSSVNDPGHPLADLFLVGETVVEDVTVSGTNIDKLTITDCRCIFWSAGRNFITEFPRDRLSSIDFVCLNVWPAGILLMVVGIGLSVAALLTAGWVRIGVGAGGLVSLIVGLALMFDYEAVKLWVVGRAEAVGISKVRYVWIPGTTGLRGLIMKLRSLK